MITYTIGIAEKDRVPVTRCQGEQSSVHTFPTFEAAVTWIAGEMVLDRIFGAKEVEVHDGNS